MMMAFEFVRNVESNDSAAGVLFVYVSKNGQTLGSPRDVVLSGLEKHTQDHLCIASSINDE